MFPLLTVTRSHKGKTCHNKTLALATELETYKCYLSYRVFWGWICKTQRRTCGSTISCAFLHLIDFLPLSKMKSSYICRYKYFGMTWSSVNEMGIGITEERSIMIYGRRRCRDRKRFSSLRAISMPLDEPTFSPSPQKIMISKKIGHTRKDIKLLFLMPFNKI